MKVNDENLWVVKYFEEKHTHELVNPEDFVFLKSNRRLTYHQKQLVNDVSDINIGPVRAFKILKQTQGGFVNVGATEIECKNLKRDMITYIGESDADMVIEKLTKKRSIYTTLLLNIVWIVRGSYVGYFGQMKKQNVIILYLEMLLDSMLLTEQTSMQ